MTIFAHMARSGTPTTVEINGFALREIRIARGIDIRLLADQIPCDRSYLAKIELGHSVRVSPAKYRQIVDAIGVKDYRALLANPHGCLADVERVG